jgi:hypothetical protein
VGHDRGCHRGVPHGAKWGGELRPPLSQKARHGGLARSSHNHTMEGERSSCSGHDDGSPTDGSAAAGNWPPFRAMSCSSQGGGRVAGTSPCSTPHYQATGSAMAKPALQQASCYRGSITRTAAVQAHTRGREDLDCGLRLHSSSCRGGGSPSQPRGGLAEAATAKHLSVSPLLTTDGVDKMPPTSGDSSHRRRITSGVYSLALV